jgi:hypothetical protein
MANNGKSFSVSPSIVVILLSVAFIPVAARAVTLDFETTPAGGTTVEGVHIGNQYAATCGISFQNSDGTYPIIAQIGDPPVAFSSPYGNDTPEPSQGDGSFFLAISPQGASADLIANFSILQKDVSAVILDIDGNEAWTVQARDITNGVLDTVILNTSSFNAGDALATPWSFHRPTADIASVAFLYTGTTPRSNTGVGFDDFTVAIPESSTVGLVGLGIVCLGFGLRRRAV